MIWALRGALLVGLLALGALALRPSEAPPAPPPSAAPSPSAQAVAAAPQAKQTPRPIPKPEIIISRNSRATPISGPPIGPAAAPEVQAVEFSYQPQQLTISPGTTVTFRNSGAEGHDFLGGGPDGTWWSGPLAPHESYRRQFAHVGSYDYVCTFHAEMRGTVTVRAAS